MVNSFQNCILHFIHWLHMLFFDVCLYVMFVLLLELRCTNMGHAFDGDYVLKVLCFLKQKLFWPHPEVLVPITHTTLMLYTEYRQLGDSLHLHVSLDEISPDIWTLPWINVAQHTGPWIIWPSSPKKYNIIKICVSWAKMSFSAIRWMA